MKQYGDITKLSGYDLDPVDLIVGGSPCQDLSVAGKRAGLEGERSGLFMEMIRIIKEMRNKTNGIYPRYALWENVPGAFSSNNGADFSAVLGEFVRIIEPDAPDVPIPEEGWPKAGVLLGTDWSLAWRTHDAQFWGVPQRSRRISLVADLRGQSAPEILFERKSLSGDSEQSSEKGQGSAGETADSIGETGKCLNPWDVQSKRIQPENGIADALYSGERSYGGGESYVLNNSIGETGEIVIPINTMVGTREKDDNRTCFGVGEPGDPQFTISAAHSHAVFVQPVHNSTAGDHPDIVGSLMASGYSKLGTQEAMNGMYIVQPQKSDEKDALIVLNDQGGANMSVTEDVVNTLRSQMKHHEPIIIDQMVLEEKQDDKAENNSI